MTAKHRRCCGIDVHKKSLSVCILAPSGKPEAGIKGRKFGTFTRDLRQLRGCRSNHRPPRSVKAGGDAALATSALTSQASRTVFSIFGKFSFSTVSDGS